MYAVWGLGLGAFNGLHFLGLSFRVQPRYKPNGKDMQAAIVRICGRSVQSIGQDAARRFRAVPPFFRVCPLFWWYKLLQSRVLQCPCRVLGLEFRVQGLACCVSGEERTKRKMKQNMTCKLGLFRALACLELGFG